MQITLMKSKIHRAVVTEANIGYVGSITIDRALMEAAELHEYERVDVLNVNNGERLQTYVIAGERNSGTICLNGAAARKAVVGDIVIILSYANVTPEEAEGWRPKVVHPRFTYGKNRL